MYSKNGRHGNFVEVKFEKLSCMSPDAHLENFIWGGEKGAEYKYKINLPCLQMKTVEGH